MPQERSAPGAQSAQQAKEQSVFISKNTQELSCRTTPRTTLEASIRQRSTLLALPMNHGAEHGSVPLSLFTRSATSQRVMGSYVVEFSSAVLRGADASLKGDKNLESYSG